MYLLREPGESDFRMMGGAHHPVPVKSEVIVRTGGGGGWGDPLERDPGGGARGRAGGIRFAAHRRARTTAWCCATI